MTDKELRRMSRGELLELLVFQMEENKKLQKKLEAAEEELKNRQIMITESGSIAEAALKLNGVFEAAEKAAEQYLENICRMAESSEKKGDLVKTEGSNALDTELEAIDLAQKEL